MRGEEKKRGSGEGAINIPIGKSSGKRWLRDPKEGVKAGAMKTFRNQVEKEDRTPSRFKQHLFLLKMVAEKHGRKLNDNIVSRGGGKNFRGEESHIKKQ